MTSVPDFIQAAIDEVNLFVSRTPYDATGTLPAASKHVNKIILLHSGSFWLAKSNGTNWLYPDNTTVP